MKHQCTVNSSHDFRLWRVDWHLVITVDCQECVV